MVHLALLATFIFAGSLFAQASYSTYGTGCKGSGSLFCFGQNQNGGTFRFQPQNSLHFALRFTPTSNKLVFGFDLYTRTQTAATASVSTQIFAADAAGRPTNPPLRTGTMVVGSTAGFYRTSFVPLWVLQGRTYYIAYHGNTPVYFPHILRANISQHFWRRSSISSWNGISNTGLPQIGQTFSVDLNRAASNTAAGLVFGLSKTNFNLTAFGAPGCWILAPFDVLLITRTSNLGKSRLSFPIPQDPTLKGLVFYNQWVIHDPPANNFGFVFSNGGAGRIG